MTIFEAHKEPYKVVEQWHSQPRHVRIIAVGAGASGLCVAYKAQKNLRNYELQIYEKNTDVGGTWYENRYPGCACDVPAHAYTYPFEPNAEWSSFYAGAPEILQYFQNFAKKYDLNKYIKFNASVKEAIWNEEEGKYAVKIQTADGVIDDRCHVLVNGTGYLNSWKWPAIDGLHDFAGTLLHSANWDTSVDWKDKKVAVIGTGSSAIQMVPQLQKTAKEVVAFMRSVTWIAPPIAGEMLEAAKVTSSDGEQAKRGDEQYTYTEEEKTRWRNDPEALTQYRKSFEVQFNTVFEIFISGSEYSTATKKYVREEMLRRIGPGHETLKEKLIPEWSPGCRRLTPGDGYLEALVQPNVKSVHHGIERVVPEGIIDESGALHEVNLIACATGFNIAFTPPFKLIGANGTNVHEYYRPEPQVYLGTASPNFPNYFLLNGVRANWGAGAVLPSLEIASNYIIDCVKKIQEDGVKSMVVRQECVDQLYEHIDAWHQRSVWNEPCRSWYKQNDPYGKIWTWGGSGLHYNKTISKVRFEHYDYQYHNNNMFSFLGNGFTEAQMEKDAARLATYMRSEDTEFEIY